MKKCAIAFMALVLAAGFVPLRGQTSTWVQNYNKALSQAKPSGKYLLLDFSGTDWCPWCIKLDNEVFSRKAFKEYAKKNFVPVLLDFPRRKVQDDNLKLQNRKLMEKYGVEGFPTVIILTTDEQLVGQTGYQPGGADAYVKHLEEIIAKFKAGKT